MREAQPDSVEVLKPASTLRRLWTLVMSPTRILRVIRYRLFGKVTELDWDTRADELGAYSVIDARHSPEEYAYVTQRQKQILYPHFMHALNGHERTLLDFGCGAGRFTSDLAGMIKGTATGADATRKLIDLCPPHENVTFVCDQDFFKNNHSKFDVIWICLVLGGFSNAKIAELAKQIESALSDDGLIFLVESTGERHIEADWRTRTIEELNSFFPKVELRRVGTYHDAGQEISILAGRKLAG